MHAVRMYQHAPAYDGRYATARNQAAPGLSLANLGALAAVGGLGFAALGGGGALGSLLRVAAPVGGAYFGWTRGSDLLRSTSVGQSMVGWLSSSPVGGMLGADPYKPVGGALGALAGLALGRLFG